MEENILLRKSKGKLALKITLSLIGVLTLVLFFYFKINYVFTNDASIDGYSLDATSNVVEEIVNVYVDEGDVVKKGELLAVLRQDIPLARKKEAIARIEVTKQDLAAKEAHFLKLKNDYERAVVGLKDRIITYEEYDHREKDFLASQAELDFAYANLELANKELETIEAELTHYLVVAAQDGVVAKRWAWLGDVVKAGQSIFTIYNLEEIWVLANIEERQIRKVKLGAKVKIHIDAYPLTLFDGEVFSLNGAAASKFTLVPQNTATGNFTKVEQRVPIRISIKKPSDWPKEKPLYLFPGISAEVMIEGI